MVENPCFLDGQKKELNSSILQANYLKREHLDIIIDFINRLLKKKVLQYSNQNQFKKIAFFIEVIKQKIVIQLKNEFSNCFWFENWKNLISLNWITNSIIYYWNQ